MIKKKIKFECEKKKKNTYKHHDNFGHLFNIKNQKNSSIDPILASNTMFQVIDSHDTKSATRCHSLYMP